MNFFVDWTDEGLAALAHVWTVATNRKAVNIAQAKIDRLLAGNPINNGFILSEDLYAIQVHPLRVYYEVFESDHVVEVVTAGLLP